MRTSIDLELSNGLEEMRAFYAAKQDFQLML